MAENKSIVIVDDHPVVREGLKAIIENGSTLAIVGEAGDSREAIRIAKQTEPDLMAVDLSLPDMSGLQLIHD